ncbi:MAG: hypothetical protein WBQ73_01710 [Candidatus Babeliales bacterium]
MKKAMLLCFLTSLYTIHTVSAQRLCTMRPRFAISHKPKLPYNMISHRGFIRLHGLNSPRRFVYLKKPNKMTLRTTIPNEGFFPQFPLSIGKIVTLAAQSEHLREHCSVQIHMPGELFAKNLDYYPHHNVPLVTLQEILKSIKDTTDGGVLNSFDKIPYYPENNKKKYFENLVFINTNHEDEKRLGHFTMPFSNPMKDLLIKICNLKEIPFGQFLRSIELLVSSYDTIPHDAIISNEKRERLQKTNSLLKEVLDDIKNFLDQRQSIDVEDYCQLVNAIANLLEDITLIDEACYHALGLFDTDQEEPPIPHIYHTTHKSYFDAIDKKAGNYLVRDAVALLRHSTRFDYLTWSSQNKHNSYNKNNKHNSPLLNKWIIKARNGEIDKNNIDHFVHYLKKDNSDDYEAKLFKKIEKVLNDFCNNPTQKRQEELFILLNNLIDRKFKHNW